MIMPVPGEPEVRGTGGQVDVITMALIDAAYDKNENVRELIGTSLYDLGRKQPVMVLSSLHSYLIRHAKLAQGHRVVLLSTIERIVKDTIDDMPQTLARDLIDLSLDEMTRSKDIVPDWQTAASNVLVAMGTRFCNEVMEGLHQKFQPGVMPHFFVVQTLGSLASANVYCMVPFLTAVLGTMLPMLGMAKHDNMKWVFAHAIGKFSEAILDYVANIDKAPDPTVKKEMFSGEIYSAYETFFKVWLQSKEPKLRLAVVEAVGHMSHILTRDKLEEQLTQLVQGILGLYKKQPEPFYVTQSLCMILDAATVEESTILEPQLDMLLNSLHPGVCAQPDFNNAMSVKNHNELLRCFTVIARSFSDRTIGFLMQKLESGGLVNSEKNRIGTLEIIKHLINSAGPYMEDKKPLVVSGLQAILTENNNKVKRMFSQVIIAMAHHEYLELEGGTLMVEFIVRQCTLPNSPPGKRPPDPDFVTNEMLRSMCENVLQLVTTTIECMERVLWPYILELLGPPQYTTAFGSIARCAAHIANKKREADDEDYMLDYEVSVKPGLNQVNIPKPPAMIARLVVMAGQPHAGGGRGQHILLLMKGLSPNLHPDLVDLWDAVVPKLIQFLEDCDEDEEKWSQKTWEDLMLKMLSKSMEVVNDDDWVVEFGTEMGKQIPLYNSHPEEKNFLYKCLGVIMRSCSNKQFVQQHLDLLFSTVRHTSQVEREGCAIGVGYCASSHLDTVIAKLEDVAKKDMVRKSTGFMGLLKDKSEIDVERVKSTVMLCHGYLTFYAPITLVTSRIESSILRSMNPHFSNVKDPSVKQNLIRAVELIGKALHPSHLNALFEFSRRGELITHMQEYIKVESMSALHSETRALAMNACSTLVQLDPKMNEADTFDLIKVTTDSVYGLPAHGGVGGKGKEDGGGEEDKGPQAMMQEALDSLNSLLREVLKKSVTPDGLQEIFKHLEPWMVSAQDHERERVMHTALEMFNCYLENLEFGPLSPTVFSNHGTLLARLTPRCTDPSLTVRQVAIDCVQVVLKIGLRYEGQPVDHKDQMVEALTTLKERVVKDDPQVLFSVVSDLAKVLVKKVPTDQLLPFLDRLLQGLIDVHPHASSGACVVLNSMVKTRGSSLHQQVRDVVDALHVKLGEITVEQTKKGTLRTVRTMATHHLVGVANALLNKPLPFDENLVECWKILAAEPQLTTNLIDHLLEIMARHVPYEEKAVKDKKQRPPRTATALPMAVSCALAEILQVPETEEVVLSNYHRLFSAIMVRVGATTGVKRPPKETQAGSEQKPAPKPKKKDAGTMSQKKELDPCDQAIETLQGFLTRSKSEGILELMEEEGGWELLKDVDKFQDGIMLLARGLATSNVQHVAQVVACLNSFLSSLLEPQRVVVVAFFAELINQKCVNDLMLVELLVNSMLGRLVDESHIVRMLCIRGLGNIASVGDGQVHKYSTTVLSAMMAGMDDKEDPEDDITLEAMAGLSKILAEIDEGNVRAILINITLRIRPCFEKEKSSVRAEAFKLFGNLSRFGDGPSKAPFLEQIHTNFISLLLHLNDEDDEVKKGCKSALRQLGPLIGSDVINDMFQKHLLEEANLHYGEFMNNLAKALLQKNSRRDDDDPTITDFSDKINFYVMGCVSFFKSTWETIKGNAAMFIGFLLGNLPQDKHMAISKEHVCGALMQLLKDPSAHVRIRAAEAMSLLHEY
ncbi:PREDICTED: maestro heat-like repeat-containing protein family member 1 isoform X1 [Branchiostoma belcheri]|uniref:Maestro heat-like repeat-containing protein family member 1 isoform X1 n=2 Tax=Branchiostoma belcheri TaxID=7741 RepID=A0A6P5A684_BRABE|nr:PREDICTED: maestro heat-like repeat-containing protein family member 1 isoform X1 [Branchiostoma belcheri]